MAIAPHAVRFEKTTPFGGASVASIERRQPPDDPGSLPSWLDGALASDFNCAG
jgi:hypothetical protein